MYDDSDHILFRYLYTKQVHRSISQQIVNALDIHVLHKLTGFPVLKVCNWISLHLFRFANINISAKFVNKSFLILRNSYHFILLCSIHIHSYGVVVYRPCTLILILVLHYLTEIFIKLLFGLACFYKRHCFFSTTPFFRFFAEDDAIVDIYKSSFMFFVLVQSLKFAIDGGYK